MNKKAPSRIYRCPECGYINQWRWILAKHLYNVHKYYKKDAAVQFAAQNIRVNCICAGFFPSQMMEDWLHGNSGAWDKIAQLQPMKKVGTLEEMAQAALFLAAEECSSFITGQVLVIDGGYTLVGRG
ncbi:SDR family NAD(P)-dependent oxidoreductase [Chloroflexota bacterium]